MADFNILFARQNNKFMQLFANLVSTRRVSRLQFTRSEPNWYRNRTDDCAQYINWQSL